MAELKQRLRTDLTAAIKAKDEPVMATLRMALTAISTEEVAGRAARELSDDEVLRVLTREAKKRREAAEAFAAAGRAELAEREQLEGEVLARYLPARLGDAELTAIAREAVGEVEATLGERPSQRHMGQVMRLATAKVAGRADGARVANAVRELLQGN
ncbi:MAG TPA: GatB/YqeY domain-containing protein [Pseudonocardiaceae bacterium]